ncbi:FAD-binding oxidoreductase [Agromyces salentinus]|uniref:Ferredoxin reductase n=1 Tax=Agromyces salentinus TaxID=269421 RepID=A0ABN2MKR2_9MICO|nr:FAD-binding oxidoreductase [Agromyces salentinus]
MIGRPSVPRSGWHAATVVAKTPETRTAARLVLEVEGWPGNAAGQHLDVRLTAPDGYTATRSYSIASSGPATGDATRVVLAVDRVPDGEVSPYLVDDAREGDRLEVHGPLGAFFVWAPDAAAEVSGAAAADTVTDAPAVDAPADDPRPVQLIAGGSGVVPLVAMAQAHADADDPTPFRLLYSVRTPDDVYFAAELERLRAASAPFELDLVYTRTTPDGWPLPPGRVTRDALAAAVIPATEAPRIFVCGSTGFVERVASWLIELGHDARDIRTERFGGT